MGGIWNFLEVRRKILLFGENPLSLKKWKKLSLVRIHIQQRSLLSDWQAIWRSLLSAPGSWEVTPSLPQAQDTHGRGHFKLRGPLPIEDVEPSGTFWQSLRHDRYGWRCSVVTNSKPHPQIFQKAARLLAGMVSDSVPFFRYNKVDLPGFEGIFDVIYSLQIPSGIRIHPLNYGTMVIWKANGDLADKRSCYIIHHSLWKIVLKLCLWSNLWGLQRSTIWRIIFLKTYLCLKMLWLAHEALGRRKIERRALPWGKAEKWGSLCASVFCELCTSAEARALSFSVLRASCVLTSYRSITRCRCFQNTGREDSIFP